MLLQPVYCRSAMTSHLSSIVEKIEILAVSGTLSCSVTLPFTSAAFTPLATSAPTGASDGGSGPSCETAGLLKFTEPLTVYLIAARYAAPMRVAGVACHRTPTFQPQ